MCSCEAQPAVHVSSVYRDPNKLSASVFFWKTCSFLHLPIEFIWTNQQQTRGGDKHSRWFWTDANQRRPTVKRFIFNFEIKQLCSVTAIFFNWFIFHNSSSLSFPYLLQLAEKKIMNILSFIFGMPCYDINALGLLEHLRPEEFSLWCLPGYRHWFVPIKKRTCFIRSTSQMALSCFRMTLGDGWLPASQLTSTNNGTKWFSE